MTSADPTEADAVGIDGCPGGWIAACLDDGVVSWAFAPVADIATLIPPGVCTGVDMPIGLLGSGLRACDSLARRQLPGAASRVFTTPPRPVLELGPDAPNADVQMLSRALSGQGVSRQALHLAPRILALDAALSAMPGHRVVEVHPELALAEIAGRVLDRKTTPEGLQQRVAALGTWLPGVGAHIAGRPAGVPVIDALDALAALWSAMRWRDGVARTIPSGATEAPFVVV